jgi:hypothetical protein
MVPVQAGHWLGGPVTLGHNGTTSAKKGQAVGWDCIYAGPLHVSKCIVIVRDIGGFGQALANKPGIY